MCDQTFTLIPHGYSKFQTYRLKISIGGGAPVRVQRSTGDPPHYIPLGTCPSHHAPFFVKLINQFIMYSTVNRAIALSCDDTLHCTLLYPSDPLWHLDTRCRDSTCAVHVNHVISILLLPKYTTRSQHQVSHCVTTSRHSTTLPDDLPLGRWQHRRGCLKAPLHDTLPRTTQATRLPRRRRWHATPSAPHKLVASAGIFYSA